MTNSNPLKDRVAKAKEVEQRKQLELSERENNAYNLKMTRWGQTVCASCSNSGKGPLGNNFCSASNFEIISYEGDQWHWVGSKYQSDGDGQYSSDSTISIAVMTRDGVNQKCPLYQYLLTLSETELCSDTVKVGARRYNLQDQEKVKIEE